jgi:ribonuclease T1
MQEVNIQDLSVEANDVLDKINSNFCFTNRKDGSTYYNLEGLLPVVSICDYYKEYTVPTPNTVGRGKCRLVIGDQGETYYTDDHYISFKRIIY